jgi:cyclomaltodextrinase / maltogenic alpha-amylase / neopullulanase
MIPLLPLVVALTAALSACKPGPPPSASTLPESVDPKAWQESAVWYQIFPERFRNGDPTNDPKRENLDGKEWAPESWRLRAWESDWYARDAWEQSRGDNFYWAVGERRYGGDIQGIIDKLDYIKDLGVTAIYLNPVFASRSHHKYDIDCFHHIEPTFGPDPEGDRAIILSETEDPKTWKWTAADKLFLELIRQAHARGLRVIVDGVFNHAGTEFFAYRDIMEKGRASRFADWMVVERWDDPSTPENETLIAGWHGIRQMPEFAEVWKDGEGDLAPGPKKYFMDITRRWMDPNGDGDPSDGIDGWRLDVSWMVPNGFWRDWNALVHSINPSAYTVTEIWVDPTKVTLGGNFDATMNYDGFAMPVKGWLFNNALPPSKFRERLDHARGEWPEFNARRLQNLLDSHDTPRASSAAANEDWGAVYKKPREYDLAVSDSVSPAKNPNYNWRRPGDRAWRLIRMGVVLQMAYVGTPFVYYGAEAGMWGANDPDCRKPMVWPDLVYDAEAIGPDGRREENPAPVAFDETLHGYYRAAIAMRRDNPVLSHGDIRWVVADDSDNTLAFLRTKESDQMLVVFCRHDEPRTVRIPAPEGWTRGGDAVFVSDGSTVPLRVEGGTLEIDMPALSAAVFKP